MDKIKTSPKRRPSTSKPLKTKRCKVTLRKDANITEVDPIANLLDPNLIGSAIMQCLIENDPEGVMEIIEDHLYALNKSKFLREADVPRSTMYQLLKRKNPTIKTLAKIMYHTPLTNKDKFKSMTMPLSNLRNTKLLNDLTAQLRKHSFADFSNFFLGDGGSGTLVEFRNTLKRTKHNS
ncbi:MAG: hypothetical protein ACRCU0_03800 [Candidatus Rhabdochlamydia sp.]